MRSIIGYVIERHISMKRIIPLLFLATSVALANDFGTWNTIQIQKSLPHDFSVGASEESRIGTVDKDRKLDEFHTTLFMDWRFVDWMSIGIQDDFVLLRRPNCSSRYRHDNRPGINLAFYQSYKGFDFMNSAAVYKDARADKAGIRYTQDEVLKMIANWKPKK